MRSFLVHFQVIASVQRHEGFNPKPDLLSEEQLRAFIAKVQANNSLQDQLNTEGAGPVAIARSYDM